MILPTSSGDRPRYPQSASAPAQAGVRAPGLRLNQISNRTEAFLRSELKRQPEIRLDVVARARALAADSNYPSMAVLRNIAEQILASPDLSDDES